MPKVITWGTTMLPTDAREYLMAAAKSVTLANA
jgi:hypothetical protein